MDAVTRASWSPRGIDAWYCGPAMDNYRCSYFYVPEHRSMRISGSYDLFPQHCTMPTFTPEQHAVEVQNELMEAVQKLPKRTRSKIVKALRKQLTAIPEIDSPPIDEEEAQRVGNTPEATISTLVPRHSQL